MTNVMTHEARHACVVSSNFQVWKLARSMNNRYKYTLSNAILVHLSAVKVDK